MKFKIMAVAAVAMSIVASTSIAEARGSCDGFQRCRCGTTAARHFGKPYSYNGFNLKQAIEWVHAFPRTSFRVGVAGVKPHHVLAIVGGSDCASATVYDDAGTRRRNVCGMTFVDPSGNSTTRISAKSHRHREGRQRVAQASSDYMDRAGASN